jgi:hypothetical protein
LPQQPLQPTFAPPVHGPFSIPRGNFQHTTTADHTDFDFELSGSSDPAAQTPTRSRDGQRRIEERGEDD